jgi:hypothetical protein
MECLEDSTLQPYAADGKLQHVVVITVMSADIFVADYKFCSEWAVLYHRAAMP